MANLLNLTTNLKTLKILLFQIPSRAFQNQIKIPFKNLKNSR